MKILDYFVLVLLIGTLMVLTSCSNDELYDDVLIPTIELDGRLPMDSNGYYHLTLNQATNQTTHRITGRVLNTTEPTKVSWKSNLSWEYQGENVPTVNGASYVSDVGEVNTMIAPIRTMVGDTLRVEATVREWLITKQINIVLE
jgi:hypothetical protein|tara:strand:- start:1660 stop:2091 length:432 start_codon:yes stop_codon:yes gene_type:complete